MVINKDIQAIKHFDIVKQAGSGAGLAKRKLRIGGEDFGAATDIGQPCQQ